MFCIYKNRDVTLVCDGNQYFKVHRLILSSSSPMFNVLLRKHTGSQALIYIRGLLVKDLALIIDFMYHGEVNVAQEELNSFLAVAEDLRVKGLTQNQAEPKTNTLYAPKSQPRASVKTQDSPLPLVYQK